jgi:diguanylate cyclase (GGDEF)-like protein
MARRRSPALLLYAIELVLVPACTVLVGAVAGAPLAAVALCVPQVAAAAWTLGRWPALALVVLSAAGWYLPGRLPLESPPAADHVSAVVGTALLAAFSLLMSRWHDSLREARAAAETDPLTGLLNRKGFELRLEAERNRTTRNARPLAVAFLDCDSFKSWNDRHGHSAGDRLLVTVAETLQSHVRNYDSVARVGGDEFAILFPETGDAAARAAIARVHAALGSAMSARNWPVTMSIGVVVFDEPRTAGEMLADADAEMYAVKRDGKDHFHVRVAPVGAGRAAVSAS